VDDLKLRPGVILCDIDGTIAVHQGDITKQYLIELELLPGVLEFWKKIDRKSFEIILLTGRRESVRAETHAQLTKLGIFYDHMIMSLPSGVRILINDFKPNSKEPTAIAYNVDRNTGLEGIIV
jgi:ribonucleotide monophosphatase NagD (HAD superfamily)